MTSTVTEIGFRVLVPWTIQILLDLGWTVVFFASFAALLNGSIIALS